jgi:hypothetical protein
MYADDTPIAAIVRSLNESKLRPLRASEWNSKTVKAVLKQEGLYVARHVPRISAGRELCTSNLPRRKNGGHPSRRRMSAAERLASNSTRTDDHWLWTGATKDGYPQASKGKSPVRLAYALLNGPLPERARLLNTCGIRICIEPSHYRLQGDPTEEFWAQTAPNDNGCLIWQGCVKTEGYGKYDGGGKQMFAHRKAYELTHGPLPAGVHVHHLCREKLCVLPGHLLPVAAGGKWSHKTLHRLEDAIVETIETEGLDPLRESA